MKNTLNSFVILCAGLTASAHAAPRVFDIHVHLHDGAKSAAHYEQQAQAGDSGLAG